MEKIYYSTDKYPFVSMIQKWLKTDNLSTIHAIQQYPLFKRENDQSSRWHQQYYEGIRNDPEFERIYIEFLKNTIKPRYGENIVYQQIPTFRVHLPGNIAVGEYHKDKEYRNLDWANTVKEVNYFLPLTAAYDSNTVWTETEEDKNDFSPMCAEYGECMEWDASNLRHGNKTNTTPHTRVSFDFRVIPESRYIDGDHFTINTKIKFNLGGYYGLL